MDKLTNIGAFRDFFTQIVSELASRFTAFAPNLLVAFVILAVGLAVSWGIALASRYALRGLGVDRLAARHRLAERAGLPHAVSESLSHLVFWLLLAVFVLSSLQALGLETVAKTMDRLFAYIPDLVGAILVAIFGFLLARFLGTVASSGAAAAGFVEAARLGFVVRMSTMGLVVIVTLEHLGIATEVLVGPLSAILLAAGLASGLGFALGARPIITHILAGHFLRQTLPRDTFIEIEGVRGLVERIGPVDTLLTSGERKWSIPNGRLLEMSVSR